MALPPGHLNQAAKTVKKYWSNPVTEREPQHSTTHFNVRLYALFNFSRIGSYLAEDFLSMPSPAYAHTFLLSAKRLGVSRIATMVAA